MNEYIRLSENYNINQLIPIGESPYKYIKSKKPYFISMMKYNETQFQQWKTTNTLKGMDGGRTNKIWADFDSEKDIPLAFKDCQTFVERLLERGFLEENIQITFSGNKGTGVIVETEQEFTINEVRAFCTGLAKDLNTFDTTMYDHQRIFRLMFSRNEKTGLYKIPITFDELKARNVAAIKEVAKDVSSFDQEEIIRWYKKARNKIEIPVVVEEKKTSSVAQAAQIDVKGLKAPYGWRPYKWAIAEGFFESGERHQALMVLAATCRGLGYDKTTAYHICKSAIEKQAERTGTDKFEKEELFNNIIEKSVYSDKWQGGQFSPKTNAWLGEYCERMGFETDKDDEPVKIIGLEQIEDDFTHFVKHIGENTILTGIPRLDKAMPLTTGMNLGIVGAASSGKTAIALDILKNTSKAGVVSVFASLDMHRNRLFEKLLYKVSGLTREALYKEFAEGRGGDITKLIKADYGNVYFYDRSCPTVADIRAYIKNVEEQTGKRVKLVMLDYFERVGASRSDDTAASKEVSGQLQDLVNDFNVCLVTLVQPNKFSLGGGPDSPITSYTAIKGSSFLYQSFRSIISIWRPFFTPELKNNDKFMQMAILKNDLGELDLFNFSWSGKRGEILELSSEGEDELQRLLDAKEARKNMKKEESNGGWDG